MRQNPVSGSRVVSPSSPAPIGDRVGDDRTHVYVGMSGGVDSSVTAALLKEQGYQVTGIYMKNWAEDLPGFVCPWADDLADAKRVAVQLDIPFKVFDFQKQYKQLVVDYMLAEYQAGRTPNPDVMCNQEIKFNLFLNAALDDGADMIATGHYAKTKDGQLYIAKDTNKDQTYFLYRVTDDALKRTIFPLGELTKTEVRAKATELGLVTAAKKDSQGICFVGKIGIKEFLQNYIKTKPGDIIDQQTSKVIGQHDGAVFYTIGQRHGLEVGGGLPYYVTSKDMAKNIVYVTTDLANDKLWRSDLNLNQLHWINTAPKIGQTYKLRLRHRAKLVDCMVTSLIDDTAILKLTEPERAIAAGQSAVLYDGDLVIGGGILQT
ncbi:MAG TPA: tRNA 2-thiouridine(34) synthase MnmA [Patescibacteria group bacterium]|jgi:tRNA-specific 2-thiouridylase|nr:tRNA 2-thiouridine(34) synthase MnmA [Patescibacteria group bacterium]